MAEELTTPGPWKIQRYVSEVGIYGRDGALVAYCETTPHTSKKQRDANSRLILASKDLLALARIIGSAYPNDPGTSDLDDEQPVSISLGTVRKAWAALAKVDRG